MAIKPSHHARVRQTGELGHLVSASDSDDDQSDDDESDDNSNSDCILSSDAVFNKAPAKAKKSNRQSDRSAREMASNYRGASLVSFDLNYAVLLRVAHASAMREDNETSEDAGFGCLFQHTNHQGPS